MLPCARSMCSLPTPQARLCPSEAGWHSNTLALSTRPGYHTTLCLITTLHMESAFQGSFSTTRPLQTATTQMTCPLHKAWGHWFLATPCLSLPSVYMFFFSLKEGLKGQRLHWHEYLSLGTKLPPRRRSLKQQARAGDEVHRPCLPTINIALGSTPSTTEQHGATARGSQHCVTSGCETCLPVWRGQHFLQ